MRYAQYKSGLRLHLVCEPGEETPSGHVVRAGFLSWPLCGMKRDGGYRMTINLPWSLGHSCKRCRNIAKKRGLL